jgi:abortive infection bacteriophage resistance protein
MFSELELRMYTLIKSGKATMWELKEVYDLDEALKLYALLKMDNDIEAARAQKLKEQSKKR